MKGGGIAESLFSEAGKVAQDPTAERWSSYLAELEKSDPEEYKLLMEDLKALAAEQQRVVTKEDSTTQQDLDFAPRLPGGGKVLGQEGVKEQDEEGESVSPTPGFVVKTRLQTGEKLFINVCQSEKIQNMSTKTQLDENGNEQEGINIPLSLGPGRASTDKKGENCIVYDIIVNTEVVERCKSDKSGATRNFLCELCLQYVEQKGKVSVDYKYKLPRMLYKGDAKNIPKQMIRKRKAPVIQEIQQENRQANIKLFEQTTDTSAVQGGKPRRPPQALAYSLSVLEVVGDEIHERSIQAALQDPSPLPQEDGGVLEFEESRTLVFQTVLERAKSDRQLFDVVKLSMSEEFLSLRIPGYYLPLDLFLPFPVNEHNVSVHFDANTFTLRVSAPIQSPQEQKWRRCTDPDPGSRPWLLANALQYSTTSTTETQDVPTVGEESNPAAETQASEKNRSNVVKDDDVLPEDRFHLADMLSQHIKDERERERKDKMKRHEEEEKEKAREEQLKAEEERKKAIQAILSQAEQQVRSESHDRASIFVELDHEDDDLLV